MNSKIFAEQPLVSVIIPVYNVEKYLRKCVDSVVHQSLQEIEIILVDDGSTDNSGYICDQLKEKDPRIKVIHQCNKGLSEARNAGVNISNADYVGFVDSDDYIENDMYELLYNDITREDAEISVCGAYDVFASGAKPAYAKTDTYFVADAKKSIEIVMHGEIASVSAVTKLYRKELLKKHPFLLGKTSEDAHFIIPYLADINRAVFHMVPKYYYIHRAGTITTRPFKKSDLSIVDAYKNNREIIRKKYPEMIELANFRYYWSLFYVIDKMLRTNSFGEENEYRETVRKIRKNYFNILSNQYVGKARKIAVTGLLIHKKLYEICLKTYVRKKKQLVSD